MPMAGCHKSRGKYIVTGGGDIYDCETEYARSRMEQKLGVITVEEFLEKILVN